MATAEEVLTEVGVLWEAQDFSTARERLEEALLELADEAALWLTLLRVGLNVRPDDWPGGAHEYFAYFIERARQAVALHKADFMYGAQLWMLWGLFVLRRGKQGGVLNRPDIQEAIGIFDEGLSLHSTEGDLYYNKACALGLLGEARPARAALFEAIRFGEQHWDNAQQDSDFDLIRSDPEFAALLATRPKFKKVLSDEEVESVLSAAQEPSTAVEHLAPEDSLAGALPPGALDGLLQIQQAFQEQLPRLKGFEGRLVPSELTQAGDCTASELFAWSVSDSVYLLADYGHDRVLLLSLSPQTAGALLGVLRNNEALDYLGFVTDDNWQEIRGFFVPLLGAVLGLHKIRHKPTRARLTRQPEQLPLEPGLGFYQYRHDFTCGAVSCDLSIFYSRALLIDWLGATRSGT